MNDEIRWRVTDTLDVPATFVRRMPEGKVRITTASGDKIVPETEVIGLPVAA